MTCQSDAPWRDEALLREKYIGEEKTQKQIADEWGCNDATISKWLDRHGIDARGKGGVKKDSPWRDAQKMREKYIVGGLTTYEIAEEWDCTNETIRRWLDKHDIPTRSKGDYNGGEWRDEQYLREKYLQEERTVTQIADGLECHFSTVCDWLEEHGLIEEAAEEYEWRDEDTLRELYLENRMNTREIGELLGCSGVTVSYWLIEHDIPRRHKHPLFHTNEHGYEYFRHTIDGDVHQIPVHRLVAYAHGGLDGETVFDDSVFIHHRNNISWDNRPVNLQAMDGGEHSSMHNSGYTPEEV